MIEKMDLWEQWEQQEDRSKYLVQRDEITGEYVVSEIKDAQLIRTNKEGNKFNNFDK